MERHGLGRLAVSDRPLLLARDHDGAREEAAASDVDSAGRGEDRGRVDFLTTIVDSLGITGRVQCRLDGRAPWAVRSPGGEVATFHAVRQGHCWLRIAERKAAIELEAGDFIVLPRGTSHVLGDAPDTRPVPLAQVIQASDLSRSWVVRAGASGARTSVVCGSFHFGRENSAALLSLLPPVVRIPRGAGAHAGALRATLDLITHEGDARLAGSALAVARLTDALLIHLLRHLIGERTVRQAGWLTALRDPRIGGVLEVMHSAPLDAWSLPSLAARAGMSRTAFVSQFTSLVGEPPMRYLSQLRLAAAAVRLREGTVRILEIAESAGYGSEAAFNRAFRRQFGVAPGIYRRRFRLESAARDRGEILELRAG